MINQKNSEELITLISTVPNALVRLEMFSRYVQDGTFASLNSGLFELSETNESQSLQEFNSEIRKIAEAVRYRVGGKNLSFDFARRLLGAYLTAKRIKHNITGRTMIEDISEETGIGNNYTSYEDVA